MGDRRPAEPRPRHCTLMGWGTGATRGSVFGLDSRAAGDVGFGEVPEELDSERTRWARDSEGAEFMMSGSPAATGGCAGRALGKAPDVTALRDPEQHPPATRHPPLRALLVPLGLLPRGFQTGYK